MPPLFAHTEPGPQSVSNEHVFPYVLFVSSGAYTGCLSLLLPGEIPPTHTPYIEAEDFKHLLPGEQSVLNWHAELFVEMPKVKPINKIANNNSLFIFFLLSPQYVNALNRCAWARQPFAPKFQKKRRAFSQRLNLAYQAVLTPARRPESLGLYEKAYKLRVAMAG